MKENRRDCLYKVIFLVFAIALIALLVCYFAKPKNEDVYTVSPSKIEVENPEKGVDITILEDGIKVVRDRSLDEMSTDELSEEAFDGDIEDAELSYDDILKNEEIASPRILRLYGYETELKCSTRTLNYDLIYDEFIDNLCKYKEDGIKRYTVVPQATITIDYGPEIIVLGYPLYTDDYMSKWSASSFYSQNVISLYSDIEEILEEYGSPNDPYYQIQPYVEYGEYLDTFESIEPLSGPYLNFDEKTLRLKVRYCILDTFTGQCFYSDYSDEVVYGKEEPPFDGSILEPVEFDNDFTVSTSEIRFAPDYITNTFDVYLTVKLSGYEKELDKTLDKIGDVIVVFENFDKNGLLVDSTIYDLAYLENATLNYFFDWCEIDPDSLDFGGLDCRVKLAYVYDIYNASPDMDFPSESKWLSFECK